MKYDFHKHHRHSLRLKGYDYSQEGVYVITICTNNRECLFGDMVNGRVELSQIGKIATAYWVEISDHFENVQLDEYIIMPNHIHGVIAINCRGVQLNAPTPRRNYYSQISPKRSTL